MDPITLLLQNLVHPYAGPLGSNNFSGPTRPPVQYLNFPENSFQNGMGGVPGGNMPAPPQAQQPMDARTVLAHILAQVQHAQANQVLRPGAQPHNIYNQVQQLAQHVNNSRLPLGQASPIPNFMQ